MLAPVAHASVPAALSYLTASANQAGYGVQRHWFDGIKKTPEGFEVYFTILLYDTPKAQIMKVCEDRRGRVYGATDVSAGRPDCAKN